MPNAKWVKRSFSVFEKSKNVIYVNVNKTQLRVTLFMKRWNVFPAEINPLGIFLKAKFPKGLRIAVLYTSSSATSIWW